MTNAHPEESKPDTRALPRHRGQHTPSPSPGLEAAAPASDFAGPLTCVIHGCLSTSLALYRRLASLFSMPSTMSFAARQDENERRSRGKRTRQHQRRPHEQKPACRHESLRFHNRQAALSARSPDTSVTVRDGCSDSLTPLTTPYDTTPYIHTNHVLSVNRINKAARLSYRRDTKRVASFLRQATGSHVSTTSHPQIPAPPPPSPLPPCLTRHLILTIIREVGPHVIVFPCDLSVDGVLDDLLSWPHTVHASRTAQARGRGSDMAVEAGLPHGTKSFTPITTPQSSDALEPSPSLSQPTCTRGLQEADHAGCTINPNGLHHTCRTEERVMPTFPSR